MSDELPDPFQPPQPAVEPVSPGPSSAEERDPFWTYFDLAVFAGMALPCMLLGFGAVRLLFTILHYQPRNKVLELLPGQALGYLLMFGVLYAMFRMYGRRF